MIGVLIGFWLGWKRGGRGLAVALLLLIVGVAILAPLAPKSIHRPVAPSTIPNSACGTFGTVVSAVQTEDIGPYSNLYAVTCSSGVVVDYAAPP